MSNAKLKKLKKISAYSTSAIAFLMLCSEANGEIIYKDIDPDIDLDNLNLFSLDFNEDGFVDIQFELNEFTYGFSVSSTYGYDFQSTYRRHQFLIHDFDAVVNNPLLPMEFGAAVLNEGFEIGGFNDWNTLDSVALVNFKYELNEFVYDYDTWLQDDLYMGIRFLIDGHYHFGWVRLSFNSNSNPISNRDHLYIHDYAYESLPETPIIIDEPSASMARNLVLTDEGETNTANDFVLSFSKGRDESTISEYRVFMYTTYVVEKPTKEELENYSSLYYSSVLPNGTDQKIQFSNTVLDLSGELLTHNKTYNAIILSVPKGPNTLTSDISLPSNHQSIIKNIAPIVDIVYLVQTDNTCSLSDFNINFTAQNSKLGISEYRIYLTNSNFYFEVDNVSEEYYQVVYPHDELNYSIQLSPDIKILGDIEPHLFEYYEATVVSMPDNISTSIESYSESDLYRLNCNQIDLQPWASDGRNTGNSSDIKVQFDAYPFEENILYYKIAVVKNTSLSTFDIGTAKSLKPTASQRVYTGKPVYDFYLDDNRLDSDYEPIVEGIDYSIVIGLVGDNFGMTLSLPSNTFRIDSIDNSSLQFDENILTITEGVYPKSTLRIYNMLGQVVFNQEILYGEYILDLNYLKTGIYIIDYNTGFDSKIKKISIRH